MYVYIERSKGIRSKGISSHAKRIEEKKKSSKNIAEFFSMCSRKKGYAETKKMGQLR